MTIIDFFRCAKDSVVSFLVEKVINVKMQDIGKVMDFNIDSKNKTIKLEFELKGESEPIMIDVTKYNIIYKNEKSLISIKGVKTSREWLNVIAKKFLEEKPIEIPEQYAKYLGYII